MSRPAEAPVALGDPFEAETQVGSLPLALFEADRLRALPQGLAPELPEFRGPFEHRGEVVPGERARLARERGRPVREQDLRLAHAARIEEDLPPRRVGGRVLRPEPGAELAERDPARLAAPARVDEPALERQQPPERGNGLRRGLLLEARDETEVARDDLEQL